MESRGLKARLYFFAFVISLLLFTVGIVLGWQWGFAAANQMKSELDSLSSEAAGVELVTLMGNESFACPIYGSEFARLFQGTEGYGAKLADLEQRKGKMDPEVMELKKDYSAMQLRNYLLQQRMDAKCGTRHNIIIYFYSNEGYSPETDEGLQIGQVDTQFGVYTYHFDVNVDSPVVRGLKAAYGINVAPTLIINGEKREGFTGAATIREVLARQNS